VVPLPAPQKSGGMPLLEALSARQSLRDFSTQPLPDDVLSTLLWAACGVNRPDSGLRTAPTAKNWQEIHVYVARADGCYLYEPVAHQLRRVVEGDIRASAGLQPFVREAPVVLIYVADTPRMTGATAEMQDFYSATDTGFVSQNVYLYCAAQGLSTVVLGWVDKPALAKIMGLLPDQRIILTQPVGYPAAAAAAEPEPVTAVPAADSKTGVWRDGVYRGSAKGYVGMSRWRLS